SRSRKRLFHELSEAERQPTKRPRSAALSTPKEIAFDTIRSQFLSAPINIHLKFLSRLFEGALSHCTVCAPQVTGSSFETYQKKGIDSSRSCCPVLSEKGQGNLNAMKNSRVPDDKSSRKGTPWSTDEVNLLVKLRRDRKLPWSDVPKLFSDRYPGRSKGSIQVYWCTKIK
ncbi:hypothetical protein BO71DRAFT_293118, partial [Aspergillus ellipticus CBS 707.79]